MRVVLAATKCGLYGLKNVELGSSCGRRPESGQGFRQVHEVCPLGKKFGPVDQIRELAEVVRSWQGK